MRIAFLGPAGTFTEEALRASEPGGEHEAVPYPTVHEVVMAVHEGGAERGVVPIENSLEGGVAATLDALARDASDVRILAEVVHPVTHCLIAGRALELGEVTRVLSHPQALAQCGRFLRERLGGAARGLSSSTAEAVRLVAEARSTEAAIGARLSAELYGATILAEGVEDREDNLTRFVWLAPEGTRPPGEPTKTSVVFWGFNDVSPGALVAVLSEFSDRGINLTKIESRPRREQLGHYMFFADLDGGADEPPVRDALEALGRRVETLRVLGSYPAA